MFRCFQQNHRPSSLRLALYLNQIFALGIFLKVLKSASDLKVSEDFCVNTGLLIV